MAARSDCSRRFVARSRGGHSFPNSEPELSEPELPDHYLGYDIEKPEFNRIILVLTPGTRITQTLLKPNRLWPNPLT